MRGPLTAERHRPAAVAGMRRICFIRFDVGGDEVAATAVGVGHRFPTECSISVSQGLELAHHYPVVVHRADASRAASPGSTGSAA